MRSIAVSGAAEYLGRVGFYFTFAINVLSMSAGAELNNRFSCNMPCPDGKHPVASGLLLILFTLTILVQRFKDSLGYFSTAEMIRFTCIVMASLALSYIILNYLLKDGLMAVLLSGLFAYMFFNGHRIYVIYESNVIPYEYFNKEIYHEITTLLVLMVLAFVIAMLAYRGVMRFRKVTVEFFMLFLLLNLLGEIVMASIHDRPGMREKITVGPDGMIRDRNLPNIYFIIFDSFTSLESLDRYWNYTDKPLEGILDHLNFNYSGSAMTHSIHTPYCVSAYLNMEWEKSPDTMEIRSMYRSLGDVRNSTVVSFLAGHHYRIRNLSLFKLGDEEPAYNYFPEVNLWGHSLLYLGFRAVRKFSPVPYEIRVNFRIAQEVVEQARANTKQREPVFLYAHLMLPHSRYLLDASGHRQSRLHMPDKERYLEQLKFARKMLVYVSSGIIRHDPRGVIVLQGDHGFRELKKAEGGEQESHSMFNALYLSGDKLPEETQEYLNEPVNNFRIVLNKYFGTEMEMEKN